MRSALVIRPARWTAHPELRRGALFFLLHAHAPVVELPVAFALEEVGVAWEQMESVSIKVTTNRKRKELTL